MSLFFFVFLYYTHFTHNTRGRLRNLENTFLSLTSTWSALVKRGNLVSSLTWNKLKKWPLLSCWLMSHIVFVNRSWKGHLNVKRVIKWKTNILVTSKRAESYFFTGNKKHLPIKVRVHVRKAQSGSEDLLQVKYVITLFYCPKSCAIAGHSPFSISKYIQIYVQKFSINESQWISVLWPTRERVVKRERKLSPKS